MKKSIFKYFSAGLVPRWLQIVFVGLFFFASMPVELASRQGGLPDKPVTALFIHQSDAVYNITFDDTETIGVTYQHPVFSVTAGDWRLAGELEVGEKVLTKSGEATVTSTEKKGGSEPVYNLEVKDLHNFLVGDEGVVVHNGCEWLRNFIKMSTSQIKKKYAKHAPDFGLPSNYNTANGDLWKETLKDFVGSDGKKHFPDLNYRDQFKGVLVLEESTGLKESGCEKFAGISRALTQTK